jgi:hypothetical protein
LGSPKLGHCSWPTDHPQQLPLSRAQRAMVSTPLRLLRSPRSNSDFGNFYVCPKHSGQPSYRSDVSSASPASRETTGHCPQFPPNLGIVPGSSNGLGVAPGHWGLPPGSRSPSAASTALHRELARLPPWLLLRLQTQPRASR